MSTQALAVEILLSGFFAVACFRARAATPSDLSSITPRTIFGLTGRLERLRRSRWQWFCTVLLLMLIRMQLGDAFIAELTAVVEFIVFLALPSARPATGVVRS